MKNDIERIGIDIDKVKSVIYEMSILFKKSTC